MPGREPVFGEGHDLGPADLWILDVPTQGTTTPYSLVGDIFAWLCLASTIALIGLGAKSRRSTTRH